jgi:hypothetical protein
LGHQVTARPVPISPFGRWEGWGNDEIEMTDTVTDQIEMTDTVTDEIEMTDTVTLSRCSPTHPVTVPHPCVPPCVPF